ncbi:MAG: hypothetical protein CL666_15835 [Balneola sp.]|nr:hypothetical protein [Balneola sp.]|tara:strand:- start:65076 stop:65519 length:444 start_codon:yes stop_codon:yes gene_type:complete
MRVYLLLLTVSFFLISCEPTRRAAPPLPPGVERGQTWEESADHGYTDDIYITPSYTTYPLKGARNLLNALHSTYRTESCNNAPRKATIRYVISEEGEVMNIHPITQLESTCVDKIRDAIQKFEFFPAEHNDRSVKMLMAITFSRDRL